jgi:hypothetical protein
MLAFWLARALFGAVVGSIGTIIAADMAKGDEPPPRYSINSGRRTMTTGPDSTFDFIRRRLR